MKIGKGKAEGEGEKYGNDNTGESARRQGYEADPKQRENGFDWKIIFFW